MGEGCMHRGMLETLSCLPAAALAPNAHMAPTLMTWLALCGLSRIAVVSVQDWHLKACFRGSLHGHPFSEASYWLPLDIPRKGQKVVMGPILVTGCRRQDPHSPKQRRVFCSQVLFRIFSLFPQNFYPTGLACFTMCHFVFCQFQSSPLVVR